MKKLIDRAAKVGEQIQIVDTDDSRLEIGEVLTAYEDAGDGDVMSRKSSGMELLVLREEYQVIEAARKFVNGDIVCGNAKADSTYGITTSAMTRAEVIDADFGGRRIEIKILAHTYGTGIGGTYRVDPSCFDLVESATEQLTIEDAPTPITVGDHVRGTAEHTKPYVITSKEMTRGEVIDVIGDSIRVKVLEHERALGINQVYHVSARHFEKIDKPVIAKFAQGDRVKVIGNGEITHYCSIGGIYEIASEPKFKYGRRDVAESYRVANASGTDQQVSAADLELYAEKPDNSGGFKVGDTVKVIGGSEIGHVFKIGSVGEVVGFSDMSGNPRVQIKSSTQIIHHTELEAYSHPESRYKAGDRIRSKSFGYEDTLKQRAPHLDDAGNGIAWYLEDGTWLGEDQFESAEPTPKFKAGDKVRGIRSGREYTLISRDESRDEDVKTGRGLAWRTESGGWVGENQVDLAAPTFKPGDKVRIKDHSYSAYSEGDVATNTGEFRTDLKLETFNGDESGWKVEAPGRVTQWIKEEHLELIDDVPVAAEPVTTFEIGDIITGTQASDSRYGYTTTKMARGKVLEEDGEDIRIEVIEHEVASHVGRTVWVEAKYFIKVEDPQSAAEPAAIEPQVGDQIIILEGIWTGNRGTVVEVRPAGYLDASEGLRFETESGDVYWAYIRKCAKIMPYAQR